MPDVFIVASKRDSPFAEAVRAGVLESGNRDVSVSESLPGSHPDSFVVLIWSAALEAGHAIDVQSLVTLWSEGRLLVARRDDTPLPLGMRDLESLPPGKSAADVCIAATGAPKDDGIRFSRRGPTVLQSKPEGEQHGTPVFSRKEPSTAPAPDVRSTSSWVTQAVVALLAVAIAGGGWYYYLADDRAAAPKKSEMVAKAEAPKAEVAPKAEAPKAVEAPKQEAVAKAEPVAKAEAKAPRAMTRSEREAQRDAEAAAKAIGRPAEQVAAASPAVTAPAAKNGSDAEAMYQQAQAMEANGKAADAVRIYRRAARAGHGKSAKRLGDIYDRGVPGVSRDYAESLQWYQMARDLGETVLTAGARGRDAETRRPEIAAPKAAPAPEVREAAKSAPVPTAPAPEEREATKAVPAATAPTSPDETWTSYGVAVVIAIVILAFGIVLWRRSRRAPAQIGPRPQSTGRTGAQAPADAATLFVSYSHKDKKRVEPIVLLMEEMGRRVWMDRTDITGQAGWAGQIVRAIRECRAVVLMASPNSYSSDQVVRELYLAMNHKKTIVPIEIEPADLPDELQYILAPFQHHRLSGAETRDVLGRALAAV